LDVAALQGPAAPPLIGTRQRESPFEQRSAAVQELAFGRTFDDVVAEAPRRARKKGSIAAAFHIIARGNLDPIRGASKVVPLDLSVLGARLVRGVLLGKRSGTR
jgi:hypothetical protein